MQEADETLALEPIVCSLLVWRELLFVGENLYGWLLDKATFGS